MERQYWYFQMVIASPSAKRRFRNFDMLKPKFRLFGGPNGSGKTHVFKKFKSLGYIHTELYVNADKIEAQLKRNSKFNFNAYRVKVDNEEFKQHVQQSGLFQNKLKDKSFLAHFYIRSGVLYVASTVKVNSYHASFIASYLAQKLFVTGQSFAFETVMSHISKVELLKAAHAAGYKTYLYFIFVDNIETNIARVQLRVLKGEHAVNEETIKSRAPRTFELLPAAFKEADSAYIIDNSDQAKAIMIKENKALHRMPEFPGIIANAIQKILKGFKGKVVPMKPTS
jgi:predicted ABC-type ATPase